MKCEKNICGLSQYLVLAGILLFALALRLGIGMFLGFNSGPDMEACGSDTVEFEHMAWSAARGDGFIAYPGGSPTAFRAPGYPLMLAGIYKLFGRQFWINRVVLSLIGMATCWLVYLLALRLRLSRGTALVAALITAGLPLQFYLCGHFMSDPLAGFLNVACCSLLVTGMCFCDRTDRSIAVPSDACSRTISFRSGFWFMAGLINGVSCLVRPGSVLVPVMLVLLSVLSFGVLFRKAVVPIVMFLLGMAITISPWTARNWFELDRFCLIASNGGSTFWGANNEIVANPRSEKWGSWITTNFDRERKNKEVMSLSNEVDRDRKEWQIGMEFVRTNPGRLPVLLTGKFYRLLIAMPESANRIYVIIVGIAQVVLLPLSLLGLVLIAMNKKSRKMFLSINAQLLTLIGTTAVFYGSERFRASYEPFLAIYAAAGVVWIFSKLFSCCGERQGKEREFLTG